MQNVMSLGDMNKTVQGVLKGRRHNDDCKITEASGEW